MAGFKDLKGQGHAPTLFMAFLYFDMSFMVWTMLGPLASEIAAALALNGRILTDGEIATLVSLPILSGAILRIVLGFGVDKLGAKTTVLISQMVVILSLITAYLMGDTITYEILLIVALGLGFAGAAFAVALPQAGQWYPPKLQGVVLGIAGAGNIGVVIDFIFAPKIAEYYGWYSVFGVGAVMAIIVFIAYAFLAKNAPADIYTSHPKKVKDYIKLLGDKDTWWFSLFYAISFGGFVGFAGAVLRPVGGNTADKVGGVKSLYFFYGMVAGLVTLTVLVELPFYAAIFVLFLIMANLGMANGAVFQLVPQRFGKDIGIMTGLVGCAGGLGGTALIKTLGWSKGTFGGYTEGFLIFGAVVLVAIVALSLVKTRWRTTWGVQAGGRI